MKELYINDKRVVLAEDTYFPFQQKVSSLDDFTIIGIPSSKTINIPVCVDNDEIFGHIASITRHTASNSNDLIGISFNQTKRVGYKLYDNSQIISEGIIIINNITNTDYEIQLFDKLTDLIEEFSEVDMDTLNLIINDEVFTGRTTADFIKSLNDTPTELKVLVNKSSNDLYKNAIVSNGSTLIKQELPIEMSDIQFRTIKNYNFEYAVPLTTVVNSINASYDDVIEIDETAESIFNETHLLLGKVGLIQDIQEYTAVGTNDLPNSEGNTTSITNGENDFEFKTSTPEFIGVENGKYKLNIPFQLVFTPMTPTAIIGSRADDPFTFYYIGAADGSYIGDLTIGAKFKVYNGATQIVISKASDFVIPCILGSNMVVETTSPTEIKRIIISGTYTTTIEYYPQLFPTYNKIYLSLDFNSLFTASNAYLAFKASTTYDDFVLSKLIGDSVVRFESTETARTGALVDGSTLFKKIKIRDFLINTCKFFNLGVKNNTGKLNIHRKYYTLTDESLPISNIIGLNVNNFDFSRLKLTQNTPDFDLINKYDTEYNKIWGEKVINTGYAIKKREKEINFGIGIPVLFTDYQSYAYDSFTNYRNAGYRRTNIGVTTGLSNGISFCFIQENAEPIWVSDDSQYETSMDESGNDIEFALYNEKMLYTDSTFKFPTLDDGSGSRLLLKHYTATPYKLDSEGNVIEALEINKSTINFAGIPDAKYPESSTHYNIFFKKYIQDIYDVNCHILDAELWIDGVFDPYKIYNYKNANYVVSEITEYDPTIPDVYNVKFLKVKELNNYLRNVQTLQYTITQTARFDIDLTDWIGNGVEYFYNQIQKSVGTPDSYSTTQTITSGSTTHFWDGVASTYTQTNQFSGTIYNDLLTKYKTINNRLYFTTQGGGYLDLYQSNPTTIYESGDELLLNYLGYNQYITLQGAGSKVTNFAIDDAKYYDIQYEEEVGGTYTWYCTFDFSAYVKAGLVPFNTTSKVKFWKFKLRVIHSGGSSEQDYTWDQLHYVQQVGYPYKFTRFTVKIENIPSIPSSTIEDNFYEPYIYASTATPDQPSWYISYDGTFVDPIRVYKNNQTIIFRLNGGVEYQFDSLAIPAAGIIGGDNSIDALNANLIDYKLKFTYSKI